MLSCLYLNASQSCIFIVSQKKILEFLELELQMVVSCCIGPLQE